MSEVNVVDKHVRDLAKVGDTEILINSGYGLPVLLGDRRRISELGVCGGVFPSVINHMVDMGISGSAISEAAKGKSAWDRDRLLVESISEFDALVNAYYAGEMQPKELSAEAYVGLHVALGVQGPNIDIRGFCKGSNTDETVQRIKKLMWFAYSNFYDGARRTISKITYHGRFSYIHMVDAFITGNGGINFAIFSKDHDNSNWSGMTSLRQKQYAPLILSEDGGHWVLPNNLDPDQEHDLELLGRTDELGKWCHHSARTIRTEVSTSLKTKIKIDSLSNKRPWDKNVGFEDAVGTISNLMTAFFAKPMETVELIEAAQLDEELPGWDGKQAREVAEKMVNFKKTEAEAKKHNQDNHWEFRDPHPNSIYESLGLDKGEANGWGEFLGKFDEVLSEKGEVDKGLFMGKSDDWKFKKLGQMAVFFKLFSPVTTEKMLEIVPKPEYREYVDGAYSAGSVRDREEFKTRMRGVIETLEAVAGEMKSEGNNQAGEVYNAAENLREQYKIVDD